MSRTRGRTLFFTLSLVVVLSILAGSLAISAEERDDGEDSLYKYLSVFTEVVNLVRRAYVEEASIDELMAGALDGSTDALDPFSTYVPAEHAEAYLAARAVGDRVSGLTVGKERGIAYAVAVAPASPAAAAEIEPGDILSQIEGRSTREMPLWRIQTLLAGPPDTVVRLDLLEAGEEREATLTLAAFEPPPPVVTSERGVDVLRISRFAPGTAGAVADILDELAAAGSDKLLLDLRGGVVGEARLAYEVAELFAVGRLGALDARGETVESFTAEGTPRWTGDVALLVDRGTLGASEILASVLRQSLGSDLVGQPTFGWAGRQSLEPLSDGSRLLITDAFFTGPDGEPIRGSLSPDLRVDESSRSFGEAEVPMEELILQRGIDRLLEGAEALEEVA